MARQKLETNINMQDAATPGLPSMVDALNQELVTALEANDNANAVAKQLGYEGAMTVGALEDEIRFYQRRTAEACLELGKRLLILKELTGHGNSSQLGTNQEFDKRVELLGFSRSSAYRFMQAAFKFSKTANLANLMDKIDSQAKLLELVTMEDDDIQQLANGETVRGLSLDDIDTMTASQLKAALRESRLNYEAQGRVLEEKSLANDKLATALNAREQRVAQKSPDQIAKELRSQAVVDGFAAEHAIQHQLGATFKALIEHSLDNGGDHKQFMLGLVTQIERELLKVREEFNLLGEVTTDDTPDWAKPEWLEQEKEMDAELAAQWDEKMNSPDWANHPAAIAHKANKLNKAAN